MRAMPPGLIRETIEDAEFSLKITYEVRHDLICLFTQTRKGALAEIRQRLQAGEEISEEEQKAALGDFNPADLLDILVKRKVVRGWKGIVYLDEGDGAEKPLPFSPENFADCIAPEVQMELAMRVINRSRSNTPSSESAIRSISGGSLTISCTASRRSPI
jgi:hypothetical protein